MFTQAVADRICAGLVEGKSLREVCRPDDMPDPSTVLDWAKDPRYQAFAQQYADARARQYELLADEIIEISSCAVGADEDSAVMVARNRLEVDSRKWMLSKMLPKIYGEKLETTLRGSIAIARDLTDNDLANIAAGAQKP